MEAAEALCAEVRAHQSNHRTLINSLFSNSKRSCANFACIFQRCVSSLFIASRFAALPRTKRAISVTAQCLLATTSM